MLRRGLSDTAIEKTAEMYGDRLSHLPEYPNLKIGIITGRVVYYNPDVESDGDTSCYQPRATPRNIVSFITKSIDPSDRGHYTKWILQRLVSRDAMFRRFFIDPSDQTEIENMLLTFDRIKTYLPNREHRDINFFKTAKSLKDFLQFVEETDFKSVRERDREEIAHMIDMGEAKILLDNDRLKVVRILSENAAILFGRNTKWCVASRDPTRLFDYLNRGQLFFILLRGSARRYAVFLSDDKIREFRDSANNLVSSALLRERFLDAWEAIQQELRPVIEGPRIRYVSLNIQILCDPSSNEL